MIAFEHVVALSAILFTIGLVGVATRRNLIVILMSVELMRSAATLAFVAANRMWPAGPDGSDGQALDGQVFALIILSVAAAEVAVGLGILLSMLRNRDSVDVDQLSLLKW